MVVLATGSRGFSSFRSVLAALAVLPPLSTVFVGDARGADALVVRACAQLGFRCRVFPARWGLFGKGAGYRRNAAMVSSGPSLCLAFFAAGPRSPGTSHTVSLCRAARIPVREFVGRGSVASSSRQLSFL